MTLKEGSSSSSLAHQLELIFTPKVQSMGYEIVSVEYQNKSPQGGAVVRVFIEHAAPQKKEGFIGIEDCIRVDHGLNELIENPDFDSIITKGFTLEISSPGLDRPLTKKEDYTKFIGKKARIKTFRAITADEIGNQKYFGHHPKQKNFIGVLLGLQENYVCLEIDREKITVPLAQIAKANLEVSEEFLQSKEFKEDKSN